MSAIRSILSAASVAFVAQAWAAAPGISPGEILIGQDVDLTGPIAVRMKTLPRPPTPTSRR